MIASTKFWRLAGFGCLGLLLSVQATLADGSPGSVVDLKIKLTKTDNVQNTRGLIVASEWDAAGVSKIEYTLTIPGRGVDGKDLVVTKELPNVQNPGKDAASTILLPDAQKGDKVKVVVKALDANGKELVRDEKKDVVLTK